MPRTSGASSGSRLGMFCRLGVLLAKRPERVPLGLPLQELEPLLLPVARVSQLGLPH